MVGPWEFFSAPSAQTAVEELERFQSTYGQDSVLKLARLQGPDAGQWAAKGCAEIQRVGYGMDVYSDPGSDETTCATSLAVDDTSSWHSLHKEHWAADDPSARPEPQTLEAVRAVLVKPSERRTHRDVDTLLPVLQRIRAISTLPEIAQRALCIVADFVQLQQGTYLYRRGDACDAVYVVLSGSVQLIIPGNPTGIYPDDILMGVVREGVGFGDVALLYTINRNADAFAQDSDCALLRLRLHDYTLITNAIQTEELLKVCQVPSNDRTGQSLRLIKRIVCDNVPYFSGNSEEQKIEFARAFQLEYWDTAGQHVFQANSPAEAMYVSLSCTVDLPAKSSSRRKAGLARTSSVMQGEVEKLSGRGDKDTLVKIQKDNPNEENCQQEGHVASGTKATFEGVMERKVTLNETHATGALPRFSRQPSDESRASHSPYPRTKSTLDSLVARNSSANSIAQAHPGDVFGASDAATPSMSLHTTSARIVNPGYLLVLSRDKLQQILNGCQEESDAQVRLTECVCLAFQIRDHQQRHTEAQTKFFSSNVAAGAGAEREELLQRLVACFTLHKLRAGDSLVLQRRTVEEVFVIQSGNCDVKVELDSVKSNDRRGHRKQVKVAALGQNALVGLSDAFFNAGTGMATYEATTRMLVYKANLGKILGLLECYQPVKANLRATFKNILMTWANRLSQSLSIIQDSCKKSGEGDVTTTWARQQLNLFLHPDAPRAAAVVSEVDTEASIDKANTPSLREHPELLSDFKSQLLQDDMSVVKRSVQVICSIRPHFSVTGGALLPFLFQNRKCPREAASRPTACSCAFWKRTTRAAAQH